MNYLSRSVYVFVFSILLASCVKHSQSPVVATVGSHKITLEDMQNRMRQTPESYQQYVVSPEGRRQFLNLIIREKVLLDYAQNAGIGRDSAYKEAVKRFKDQWETRLKEYQETLMIESALRKLRSKDLAASDADVQAYYDSHKEEFDKPVEIFASHILVSTEPTAQEVLKRLQGGESFEKLARELSKDPVTAARGGKLTPFRRGMLVPEFEEVAFRLKDGETSGIVKTQFGFHIIRKTGQNSFKPRSFADAKEEIRTRLERDKFDQWVKTKQALLSVSVDDKAMALLSQEPPKS